MHTERLPALRQLAASGWHLLRRLCGEDAYEIYLAHQCSAHPDAPTLSRREFEHERQQSKWNRISRCC